MKDLSITVEFLTPCLVLGPIDRDTNCEYFERDSHNNIVWNQAWWYSAITKTISMFKLKDVSAKDFNWALAVVAKTETYNVKYSGTKYRNHECLPAREPVTFEAVVPDDLDEEVINELFTRMGKYVGISPYGYNLGYGKFGLLSIEIT